MDDEGASGRISEARVLAAQLEMNQCAEGQLERGNRRGGEGASGDVRKRLGHDLIGDIQEEAQGSHLHFHSGSNQQGEE